jgi:hypothetical protein
MEKSCEKLECKVTETVSSEDSNASLRPWLKPVFEREVMKDALSGPFIPDHAGDGGGGCS